MPKVGTEATLREGVNLLHLIARNQIQQFKGSLLCLRSLHTASDSLCCCLREKVVHQSFLIRKLPLPFSSYWMS